MVIPTSRSPSRRRLAVLMPAVVLLAAGSLGGDKTDRVSLSSGGEEGNDGSDYPALSASGRWAAFGSSASNLVADDTNGDHDVFLHDRKKGVTTRVSVTSAGAQVDQASSLPALSASGRLVAFDSFSTELVPDDTNGDQDVFVHDAKSGLTERVSLDAAGAEVEGDSYKASISANGRIVAFYSAGALVEDDANDLFDVYVRDRKKGLTERVSVSTEGVEGNQHSDWPSISGNGRWVVWESIASNLVADDDNGKFDIFLRDRKAGTTTRMSVSSAGDQADSDSALPVISANGRWVAFESTASNLVDGDRNAKLDVFVHDRVKGTTLIVSVSTEGLQGTNSAGLPSISGNGRWVGFESGSAELVAGDMNGDTDIFVHDVKSGLTVRASVASDGGEGSNDSFVAALSRNGKHAGFMSASPEFVADDGNASPDVFVRALE